MITHVISSMYDFFMNFILALIYKDVNSGYDPFMFNCHVCMALAVSCKFMSK